MKLALTFATVFLASGVEAVEALTVVLAVGVTAGWGSALRGAAWALAVLAAIVAALGPALLALVPLAALRTGVGIFLLLLGLDWLRKAILRHAGRKALRDEAAAYQRSVEELRGDARTALHVGQAMAFKGTFLEGLEVALIVISLGASSPGGIPLAASAAALAGLTVCAAGYALRRPLAHVPENGIKTIAGIMLTSFGTFWSGEGLGIAWWHEDLSIVILAAVFAAVSAGLVAAVRVRRAVPS